MRTSTDKYIRSQSAIFALTEGNAFDEFDDFCERSAQEKSYWRIFAHSRSSFSSLFLSNNGEIGKKTAFAIDDIDDKFAIMLYVSHQFSQLATAAAKV